MLIIYIMADFWEKMNEKYNDIKKNVRLKNRINNENLEGIMIVEKV